MTHAITAGPLARPTLLPGLRRLWRGRRSLQLGVDPARAVVLELPDAGAARLLDLLDGTRSERAVITDAARYQIREADARALLDALREAGLVVGAQTLLPHTLPNPLRQRLVGEAAALALRGSDPPGSPAQILRRRAAARVIVAGRGRLVSPVALALAQAGVGHVSPVLDPAAWIGGRPVQEPSEPPGEGDGDGDGPGTRAGAIAGVPAGPADLAAGQVEAAIAHAAPGTRTGPIRRREASFVVQAGATGPANLVAASYARHRLAHLPVGVRDGIVVVGPLVPPTGGPCLHCLDLHRQDRDPDWPQLAAQLAAAPDGEPCPAATLLSAAGLVAGEVLSWLDGDQPSTLGTTVEVVAPGQLRRRSWSPHPDCRCFRQTPHRRRP